MTETDKTTKRILLLLQIYGHTAWRQNAGAVPGRRAPLESKGIGDVVAILKPYGRHLEVEVKTGRDRQRPEQTLHAAAVRRAGGIYILAKDFDDFVEQVNAVTKGDPNAGDPFRDTVGAYTRLLTHKLGGNIDARAGSQPATSADRGPDRTDPPARAGSERCGDRARGKA